MLALEHNPRWRDTAECRSDTSDIGSSYFCLWCKTACAKTLAITVALPITAACVLPLSAVHFSLCEYTSDIESHQNVMMGNTLGYIIRLNRAR